MELKSIVIVVVLAIIALVFLSFFMLSLYHKDVAEKQEYYKELQEVCIGDARCMSGTVTRIVDGDTIWLDNQSIRFALSSSPELDTSDGITARTFVQNICPVGSAAVVDEDDNQTRGSYGRVLGVVYCNGINLNEAILDSENGIILKQFCEISEFARSDWATRHGC